MHSKYTWICMYADWNLLFPIIMSTQHILHHLFTSTPHHHHPHNPHITRSPLPWVLHSFTGLWSLSQSPITPPPITPTPGSSPPRTLPSHHPTPYQPPIPPHQDTIEWRVSRTFFYWRLKRLLLESELKRRILDVNTTLGNEQCNVMMRRWFVEANGPVKVSSGV